MEAKKSTKFREKLLTKILKGFFSSNDTKSRGFEAEENLQDSEKTATPNLFFSRNQTFKMPKKVARKSNLGRKTKNTQKVEDFR